MACSNRRLRRRLIGSGRSISFSDAFMDPLELTAVAFGLACVWLTVRQHIACWPTGLVMVILYIYIFFQARLYSDAGLQVVYVVLQIYGWYNWLHGGEDRGVLAVARIRPAESAVWVGVAFAGTTALGYFMSTHTDAALPFADATVTVLSLIAQYLMARKILESWLIWITVDVVAIYVFLTKGLHLTAGLYAVFLVLATMGYFEWRRTLLSPAPATT